MAACCRTVSLASQCQPRSCHWHVGGCTSNLARCRNLLAAGGVRLSPGSRSAGPAVPPGRRCTRGRYSGVCPSRALQGLAPAACSMTAVRGCSSMAEHQLPKLTVRVRFPSPAPCDLSRHRNGLNPQWVKSACPALVRQGRFETHVRGLRPLGRGQVADRPVRRRTSDQALDVETLLPDPTGHPLCLCRDPIKRWRRTGAA